MKLNHFFICFIFWTSNISAQFLPSHYFGIEDKRLERLCYADSNYHASIKPFMISLQEWKNQDSARPIIQNKKIITFIKPIFNIDVNQNLNQFHQIGAESYLILGEKISAQLSLNQIILTPNSDLKEIYDSIGILTQYGRVNINSKTWQRTHFEGSLHWQTLPYLSFKTGMGKHIFGDGFRSLFLSDNAPPYPYIQGIAKIWKVQYLVQYCFLFEPTWNNFNLPYNRKNATVHYLSWNINKRLNFNAFETVIWQVRDSIGYRGFDINYINPIIFFRPIEFSIGSPDNVIMGMGFRYRFFRNSHIYSQFLLDEFKLSELRAKKGWWGNKLGVQVGIKTYRLFNNNRWFALLECNVIRPFTYSHSDYLNNWGQTHQPMAHPLGANFIEWVVQSSYNLNKWTIAFQLVYQRQGQNDPQFNAGNNIYLSYKINRNDYGNHLLVGSNYQYGNMDFRLYYLIKKSWHLHSFLQIDFIHKTIKNSDLQKGMFIHFGFVQKANIFNK